jgi:protein O-mannosyl-transferase
MKKRPVRRNYLPVVLIVLVTFISYLPVLGNGFVNWDDDAYVVSNPLITSIHLTDFFTRFFEGNYHPLTLLAYSIEFHFFKAGPAGYHIVNLLIHLVNLVLVFLVVLRLTGKDEVAWIASLLFGIHPLHVESVAWVSELKDLLYSCFFLSAYLCYLQFRKYRNTRLYILCFLFFVLSLLSKAMAVSLPAILLLTDYFEDRKLSFDAWVEKLPFFALSLIFGVVAILAQGSSNALRFLAVYSFPQRAVLACYGFIRYLFKLTVPYHLSAIYPYPNLRGSPLPGWVYAFPFVLLALVVAVALSARFSKRFVFGFGFFAITVFLVLQLLPVGNAIVADRYMYIPSIGIFCLAGEEISRRFWKAGKTAAVLLVLAAALLVASTYSRCMVWKDGITLWNDVIAKEDTAAVAYHNRAVLLMQQHKTEDALRDYNKAIQLSISDPATYVNRGNIFVGQKRFDEALSDYNRAAELDPTYPFAYNGRGAVLIQQQRYAAAISEFTKAVDVRPGYGEGYFNRSIAEYYSGQQALSCRDLQRAVSLSHPGAASAYSRLCRYP